MRRGAVRCCAVRAMVDEGVKEGAEVFPLRVRGSAFSIAAVTNFSSNICMVLLMNVLQDALTQAGRRLGHIDI